MSKLQWSEIRFVIPLYTKSIKTRTKYSRNLLYKHIKYIQVGLVERLVY